VSIFKYIQAALAWGWKHRTKVIGVIGTGAAYAYANQEQLGLIIPAASLAHTMMGIGVVTFLVGLYNTFNAPT
jgi:hypothetical protein